MNNHAGGPHRTGATRTSENPERAAAEDTLECSPWRPGAVGVVLGVMAPNVASRRRREKSERVLRELQEALNDLEEVLGEGSPATTPTYRGSRRPAAGGEASGKGAVPEESQTVSEGSWWRFWG